MAAKKLAVKATNKKVMQMEPMKVKGAMRMPPVKVKATMRMPPLKVTGKAKKNG